jgi:uncharacterized protein (DUF983 family)
MLPPAPGPMPPTFFGAIRRGFRGKCPACGNGRLFAEFLKPVEACAVCSEDWAPQRADDFPPYIVILVLGHAIIPGLASVEVAFHPPMWVHLALWLPLTLILGVGLLQPVKGAVIAYQWWHRMGGFLASRRRTEAPSDVR